MEGMDLLFRTQQLSPQQNAGTVLQPVMILLTPETVADLPPFGKWLESQGVSVINIHNISFQNLISQHYPDYLLNGAVSQAIPNSYYDLSIGSRSFLFASVDRILSAI